MDGTADLGAQEEQLIASIPAEIPYLVVWNKLDQTTCLPLPAGAVACSALCGWGLAEVQQAALDRVAPRLANTDGGELLVTSARQATVLQSASAALDNAHQALTHNAAPEIIAGELRVATARLGELTGHEVTTQVLDEIFARFCVGK